MSDDTQGEGPADDFVNCLVAEAAHLLEEIAAACMWKDVIQACFSSCLSPLEDEPKVYDDACRREMRIDIIWRVLWELSRIVGERSPEPKFAQNLDGDLAAHFESFGFEDAWHWKQGRRTEDELSSQNQTAK